MLVRSIAEHTCATIACLEQRCHDSASLLSVLRVASFHSRCDLQCLASLWLGHATAIQRNGQACIHNVLAGKYKQGLRSGTGVLLQPDGGWYTGAFANDVFEGEGTYEYPDGTCYVGTWAGGKKSGQGSLTGCCCFFGTRLQA
jgi:MORN repeat